jgi:general L-amino acid transport system substrate-binding protein
MNREVSMRKVLIALVALAGVAIADVAAAGPVLDRIRSQQVLRCGVGGSIAGFSLPDAQGQWHGIDVDYCRALAAAVLGDPQKVTFVPLSLQQRFTALASGEVDVLARDTIMNFSRDVSLGIVFVGINFYTGAGFIVRRAAGVTSLDQMNGATFCITQANSALGDLADVMRIKRFTYQVVQFERFADTFQAFLSGRCDAAIAGAADLAAARAVQAPNPADYLVLEQVISRDPYGPAVARGDTEWFSIARWVLIGLIDAEERGITRANARELARSAEDPAIRRLLGAQDNLGGLLGLAPEWMLNAIAAVGNYGEIYDRYFGPQTPINLPRGINNIASRGGLHYAPPFR